MRKRPFTKMAQAAIREATEISAELHATYIGTEHILIGLTTVDGSVAQKVLCTHGVTTQAVKSLIKKTFDTPDMVVVSDGECFSPKAEAVLQAAGVEAEHYHIAEVGTEIFEKIIACASGKDQPFAEKYGMHNYLCIFNPAPIT